MTTTADLLAELAEIRNRQAELTSRRDEVIRTLMTAPARVPRGDIAAAAGIKEARLYQIAPGGRLPTGRLPLFVSTLLPELSGLDELPPFEGGDDADLVRQLAKRINERRRNMSEWGILSFVRAVRAEFPDGVFDAADPDQQDRVAKRAGYRAGTTRLRMSRLVMEGIAVLA